MKNTTKFALGFVAVLAIIAVTALRATVPSVNDINYKVMTLGAADGKCVIATHAATNLNLPIDMTRQSTLAMLYQFTGVTDTVNTCTAVLSPSLDGTTNNMDETQTISIIRTGNAAVRVNGLTNLSAASWGGYRFFVLRYITNGTADFTTNYFVIPYKHVISGNP